MECHCCFNDISNKEFFTILETFINYYIFNLLQKNEEKQDELTQLLCTIHGLLYNRRYKLRFFRKLNKGKRFRDNYQFWELIFYTYFESGHDEIARLASRILLRKNPNNKKLWEFLTEIYDDIIYRKAIVKKILSDIEKKG